MRSKLATLFVACVGLCINAAPLIAHHGNAAYDYDKKVTFSGVVTEWIWANPHSWLKVDAKNDKGEVQHWVLEAGGVIDMARQGWSHGSFKAGDEITVTVIQARNGQPIGRFVGKDPIILNGKPFAPESSANTPAAKP